MQLIKLAFKAKVFIGLKPDACTQPPHGTLWLAGHRALASQNTRVLGGRPRTAVWRAVTRAVAICASCLSCTSPERALTPSTHDR